LAYTSFFRDADALKAISELAIPELAHLREIRVWDAGCATGEEPYTLAILFASRLGAFMFRNLDILATDHEESSFPQFARRISAGLYSRTDIFWVPEGLRALYFVPTEDPELFQATQEIRDRVRFLKHDLLSLRPPAAGLNLIVCKNVLMHFTAEEQEGVLAMFHESLAPASFLALDGSQGLPVSARALFERIEPGLPLFRNKAH
jgi:chemotaxis protein methyltransferase CheR